MALPGPNNRCPCGASLLLDPPTWSAPTLCGECGRAGAFQEEAAPSPERVRWWPTVGECLAALAAAVSVALLLAMVGPAFGQFRAEPYGPIRLHENIHSDRCTMVHVEINSEDLLVAALRALSPVTVGPVPCSCKTREILRIEVTGHAAPLLVIQSEPCRQ